MSQHHLIPGYVREMLGPEGRLAREFGDNVPLFELDGLRSRILGDAAEARHAGNNAKASILDAVAAGLRDDMDGFVGGMEGPAGEALRQARALAKETFDTFDTDALRKIMATSGGRDRPRTDPVISLERTVGAGGRPAGVYVRQIQDALARHGEDATGPISDIIRDDFVRGFESRGVQGAQRVLNNYRDVLDRIPGLRDEFETALQGVFNADQLADRVAQIKSRMGDPAYSRAQVFLSGVGDGLNIDQGIQNIIRSQNPAAVSRDIMNRLRRDPTGEAVDGFRSAFVDYLIREATVSPAQLDGGSVVDGNLFNQLIGRGAPLSEGQRPPARRALEEVFTPNQMRRMDELGDAFNRMRQDIHATPLGQRPITDGPGIILDNLASFSGLLLASKAGGNFNIGAGQLRLSQQGSKLIRDGVARGVEDPARRLISDAVLSNDKRLLRSLLVDASNEQEMARAGRRLNAWLAEQGPRLDTDEVMERLDQLTELGVPDFGLAEDEWWKDIEIRGGSREGGTLGEVLGR